MNTSLVPRPRRSALLRGHYMTLVPFLARKFRPLARPETVPWSTEFEDETVGPVRVSGRLMTRSSDELLVVLHGLGGSAESGYMALALRAAEAAGRSCLLLNCRGADRLGADLYHSGLIEDVAAALASEHLSRFKAIDLMGYSIGGHITLRYAMSDMDPRVRRVAAIGAPLDLQAAAFDFDAPGLNVYRMHVLDSLKEIYTAAYQRRPTGLPPEKARKISRIVQWDDGVIAPRFGFRGAAHYYSTQSAGPRLKEIKVEALYVGAASDPMVRARPVDRYLRESAVQVHWEERAGHLGFREDFDLGLDAPRGLESQVLAWLSR